METQSTNKDELIELVTLLIKIYREAHGTGAMTLETEKEISRVLLPYLMNLDRLDMASGVSGPIN